MQKIENQVLDEERALYNLHHAEVIHCTFDGPADGESALKECSHIKVENCFFNLRYPFWHVSDSEIIKANMTENCRAALWYDHNLKIRDSHFGGIKALRECRDMEIENCTALSIEFGWKCSNVKIDGFQLESEYPFLENEHMVIQNLKMKAKYSFQYVRDVVIENSVLDTKDAFWHAENVVVKNSVLKGEYLAWYSKNLKLINCHIIGTQPFCYCDNLILENCTMEHTDLAFERSTVQAKVNSSIDSIKNPINGWIEAKSIDEIIFDLPQIDPAKTMIRTEVHQ